MRANKYTIWLPIVGVWMLDNHHKEDLLKLDILFIYYVLYQLTCSMFISAMVAYTVADLLV